MRRILLASLFIALFSFVTNAQVITKGQKIIGGSFSGRFTKEGPKATYVYKSNYFNVSATYGKAIKDNLIAGVLVNLNDHQYENSNNGIRYLNSSKTIGTGVFIEKFFTLSKGFSLSTNAGLSGGRIFRHDNSLIGDSLISKDVKKETFVNLTFTPSLNFQFSKRLLGQLNMYNLFSYNYSNVISTNEYPGISTLNGKYTLHSFNSSFNSGIRLSDISVSFRYIIN